MRCLILLLLALLTGCGSSDVQTVAVTKSTAASFALRASKSYSPTTYLDGTQAITSPTSILLPYYITVSAGNGGVASNRVALSFAGGTVDNTVGIRCYYQSSSGGALYSFASCDGGSGGLGVLPYYVAGDTVQLLAGDTVVLHVMESDTSATTSVGIIIDATK